MNRAFRLIALLAGVAAFASPPLVADQGKSGDGHDWGCGGHPMTAGSRNGKTGDRQVIDSQEAWHVWWYLNRPVLLADLTYRAAGPLPKPAVPEKWRDDARAALRDELDSGTASLAAEAVLGLGRSGDGRDLESVTKVACDTHRPPTVRRFAALSLGLLPAEPASAKTARDGLFSVIRESIGNNDDNLALWGNAAYALGLRGDVAAVPRLADLIVRHRDYGDADHEHGIHREVLAAAIGALGLFGEPVVEPDLVDALKSRGADGVVRERRTLMAAFAAAALARLGQKSALPALREAATDDRLTVRRAAILALGALAEPNDAETSAVLTGALASDKDDPTRCMAAISLGRSGAPEAPAVLMLAYARGTQALRSYAVLALGLFSRRKLHAGVNEFLLAELSAKHDTVETGALCIANGLARNRSAAPRLIEIAGTPGETEMRSHAAFALGLLGAEAAPADVLLDLVVHGDGLMRHEAALALGLARRNDGVDALMRVLDKGKSTIDRGSAAVALGRIAGAEAAPLLTKILRDDHELNAVRTCAAHGLGLLLDRAEGTKLGRIGADVNWLNEISHRWMQTEVIDQMLLISD